MRWIARAFGLALLASPTPSLAECGAQSFGLGLTEDECKLWAFQVDEENSYVALDFRFSLSPGLQGASPPQSLMDSLKRFARNDEAILLSVVPIVGNVKLPEKILLSYDLTQSGSQARSMTRPTFFTPFILNGSSPLAFEIRLRTISEATLKAEDIVASLSELVDIGEPSNVLLSRGVKESLGQSAGIVDRVVGRFVTGANQAEARVEMGGATGVAVRKLRIHHASDSAETIGTLLVKVVARPSLASVRYAPGDATAPAQDPEPDDASRILNLSLPAVATDARTLVSALRGDETTFLPVSSISLKSVRDDELRDACTSIKDALRTQFGLSPHDSLRAVAALLERHARYTLLERDDTTCFTESEWREIEARKLFNPQKLRTDWSILEKATELFATGLRRGFSGEYARGLASFVELEDSSQAVWTHDCRGDEVSVEEALRCLDRVGLNRVSPFKPSDLGPRWVEFFFTRRDDVVRLARDSGLGVPADAALATAEVAERLADDLDVFYRMRLRFDLTGTSARVDRVRIERKTRIDLAKDIGTDVIRSISLSCWVASGRSGNDFCQRDRIPVPEEIALN